MKVLSQTASASACERNWSTFALVHTKQRNRLAYDRLQSLVYCSYNTRLRDRDRSAQLQPPNIEDPLGLVEHSIGVSQLHNDDIFTDWIRSEHLDDALGRPDEVVAAAASEEGIDVNRVVSEEVGRREIASDDGTSTRGGTSTAPSSSHGGYQPMLSDTGTVASGRDNYSDYNPGGQQVSGVDPWMIDLLAGNYDLGQQPPPPQDPDPHRGHYGHHGSSSYMSTSEDDFATSMSSLHLHDSDPEPQPRFQPTRLSLNIDVRYPPNIPELYLSGELYSRHLNEWQNYYSHQMPWDEYCQMVERRLAYDFDAARKSSWY